MKLTVLGGAGGVAAGPRCLLAHDVVAGQGVTVRVPTMPSEAWRSTSHQNVYVRGGMSLTVKSTESPALIAGERVSAWYRASPITKS